MKFFTAKDGINLFYKDIGRGAPVILIHGWPLNSDMWEEQIPALLHSGFRVIAYDRRGFGRSETSATGYDYDTLASDLHNLIEHLQLDKVSLVGFSMGGGEVARYLSTYGSKKICCVTLIGAITPMLMESELNPTGVPEEKIREIYENVKKDRFAFLHNFFKEFYGVTLMSNPVSHQALVWSEALAAKASLLATVECVNSFGRTDFHKDLESFTVPTQIIHGTADKIVPMETTADLAASLLPTAFYKKYDHAPHGLNLSHKDELNEDLVSFMSRFAFASTEGMIFEKRIDSMIPGIH